MKKELQDLLSQKFKFSSKALAQTQYKIGRFKFGAITIFRTILVDRRLCSMSMAQWFAFIVHEQVHREDMANNPFKGLGFYFMYVLHWALAGFSYRKNKYEIKAIKMEQKAFDYYNSERTVV